MCLATPVKIKKLKDNRATLEDGKVVNLSLVSDAKAGDWLLCHGDLAINKIEKEEAQEILKLANSCHQNAGR